ncbi:MAG: flagellar basal body rod protein [Maricaulaceae bacterium]|nr:flagellar basal body rod protein [Maricaulaceae bacterium]
MTAGEAPVLTLLRETLSFNAQRQRAIAQNVANASTPGFVPTDYSETSFHRALQQQLRGSTAAGGVRLTRTSPGHIAPGGAAGAGASLAGTIRAVEAPDGEVTANGNAVVLEQQMLKATEARMRYETALSLYQKSLGMIRSAARSPAR